MLPVHWSIEALDNLDEIIRYIAKHNPAARPMHALLQGSVDMAAEYPQMYRVTALNAIAKSRKPWDASVHISA